MTGRFDHRRTLLQAALAAGGASVLAAASRGDTARAGAAIARAAAATKPAGSDLGAIEHVVFLMQENRSFDHYYGTYPGVRGFDDHPHNSLGVFAQAWPGGRDHTLLPFHLDSSTSLGICTQDLDHSWHGEHLSWSRGDNKAFVSTHVQSQFEGPEHGVLTMGYYRRPDLPFYYALADAFTIGDNYHCSVLGPTHPNRLMALSGTVGPYQGPRFGSPGAQRPSSVPRRHLQRQLGHRSRSAGGCRGERWRRSYNPAGRKLRLAGKLRKIRDPQRRHPPLLLAVQEPELGAVPEGVPSPVPGLLERCVASEASCPAVSWLIPPAGYDEHPSAPPALGEWFTSQVVAALVAQPDVWSKTVLFHMYDENDGFFDHVPPPSPPKGTAGEYLTQRTLPADAKGVRGPVGMGFRVPMLVVSPFSRGGHVASDVFDHTSQLRFLEERFAVKAPNISAWRRKTAGDLTSTLHMGQANTSAPTLPSTADDQMANMMALGCTQLEILNLQKNMPIYPVPAHQSMPTQERA